MLALRCDVMMRRLGQYSDLHSAQETDSWLRLGASELLSLSLSLSLLLKPEG